MKKGILIDVRNRTITEVEVIKDQEGSQLQSMYKHIKCGTVDAQTRVLGFDRRATLWRDSHVVFLCS